jgi:hypothetical protein
MARDLNIGLGLRFQQGFQEGFINERGLEVLHEIGIACTCRSNDTFNNFTRDAKDTVREPFCPRCGQHGWIFREPVIVVGIFTGVRHQKNILDAGNYMPGDATFSPSLSLSGAGCGSAGERRIGAFDKITATWPEPVDDGHVIVRGAGSKAAAIGINTSLDDDEDRLWYEPAKAIWCEDENDVIYYEGSDFILGPGKIIKWIGNRPAFRVKYSIKYEAFFEWIVWQPPGERRDYNADNLGELVMLRKRHVIHVNDSPFATSQDKQSLQASVKC